MPVTISSVVDAVILAFSVMIAGLVLYVAVAHYRLRHWLQRYGVLTSGVVVRFETDTTDFEASHFPVVRFYPAGHDPIEARYGVGHTPPAYAVGQAVLLRYDPAQPTRFVLGDKPGQGRAWLLALILVTLFAWLVSFFASAE